MIGDRRRSRVCLFAACLGVVFAVACGGSSTMPSQLPLGQSFDLRAGTSAVLQDGLVVEFDAVRSDSRCPMDAICVWAGEGIVAVRLSQPGAEQAQRELHTNGSPASYLSYSITLNALQPYPRSDRPIQPGDYVATFTVDAR